MLEVEEGDCTGWRCLYTGHIDFAGSGPPMKTQLFWMFPEAWTSISRLQWQHLGNRVSFINPAPNFITWYKKVNCTPVCFIHLLQGPSHHHCLCPLSPKLPPELHLSPWAEWHGDYWLQAVTPNEVLARGDSCPLEQPKNELSATLEAPERDCCSPIKEELCVYMHVWAHRHMCKGTGGGGK